MKQVFADTSFYSGFLNPKDAWHKEAHTLGAHLEAHTLTTEYVLLELGSHLCLPKNRPVFTRFVEMLNRHPKTTILPASPVLFDAGFKLFSDRTDKSWSLTDCISFAVMNQRNITEVLSTDRHFIQAGFVSLFRA